MTSALNLLNSTLTLCVYGGIAIQLAGIGALAFFLFRKRPKLRSRENFPGVTMIKPCYSNNDNEAYNFEALFNQDYKGPFQLLFVVSSPNDPIVVVVEQFLKRYPSHDASIVVSETRKAYWRKVDALYDGHQKVKHEYIIWSDSDTIVRTDYLSCMVAFMEEPGISVVTTPQYDTNGNTFASSLKNVGNNCDVGTFLMLLNIVSRKKKIGWGHSMGFRKSEFDVFGDEAWHVLRTHFADDQMLPALFTKKGKRVVFRNVYCPVDYSNKKIGPMITQQARFAICQKVAMGNRWGFMLGLLGLPMVPATFLLLTTGFSAMSVKLWLAVLATRVLVSLSFEGWVLGSIVPTLRYFWAIPLWDLLKVYLFTYAFFTNSVTYHGKTYRFTDRFQLEEVKGLNAANSGLTVMP